MSAADQPLAARLRGFGTSVFSEMTALAQQHGAVNLGQGFPDDDPPAHVVAAAHAALDAGHHQYAPGPGVPALRRAVADHRARFHGQRFDPDTEVTVTFGATEGVAAALLALCDPGDEVLVLEPVYDAYTAVIAMAGAVERRVPLRPPAPDRFVADGTGWSLDLDHLAAAVSVRTRVLLLNSPHNPTGLVLTEQELDEVARLCVAHDLVAVTDEVYEHLVVDAVHVPLGTRPGMAERTVTVSSAGKTFRCTGWKVGWVCAPPPLTTAVRTTKQFLSFAGGTPLQHGVVTALDSGDEVYADVAATHRRRRDRLVEGLRAAGVPVTRPAGTYFATADLGPLGHADAAAFCRWAPEALGVAAVPISAFVTDPEPVGSLVRLACCKADAVLDAGIERLGRVAASASAVPGIPHQTGDGGAGATEQQHGDQ